MENVFAWVVHNYYYYGVKDIRRERKRRKNSVYEKKRKKSAKWCKKSEKYRGKKKTCQSKSAIRKIKRGRKEKIQYMFTTKLYIRKIIAFSL